MTISKIECSQSQRVCRIESQRKILDSLVLIFLGSKGTADGDCSHEIKRRLLFGRKTITNLESILKSRDITLQTKAYIGKAMVFLVSHVQMWELHHKEAKRQRIDAVELWCWRRLFRVPWTARRSSQSILKEINPEHSFEALMLKLQYFGHLMQTADSLRPWCCERLKAGEAGDRGWDGWMASLIQWTQVWTNSRGQWKTGKPGVLQSMRLQRVRHDLATEQQEQIIKWHLFQGWKDFFNTPH